MPGRAAPPPRATVKSVAERAGVSPKTVSNVLNGTVRVSSDTRARVEAAVAELDYVPNLSARGLRNGRSGVLALALPDLSTMYSAEITQAVADAARDRGYGLLVEETGARPERELELVSRASRHLIDGLILNPVTLDDSAVRSGGSLPPAVLIGEVLQDRTDGVMVDSRLAAREMTEHLLAAGARRIAILGAPTPGAPRNTATSELRQAGWEDAMAAAGLEAAARLRISTRVWTPGGGAEAMRAALAAGEAPDAVFCFTDSLAIGAISALAAAGLSVPGDVLVAGFDDIRDSAHLAPPLTTVSFDKAAFAERAVSMLLERIDEPGGPARRALVPHRVVARASSRPRR